MALHNEKPESHIPGTLRNQIPAILKHVSDNRPLLRHNQNLFEIFEGDLLTHILNDLRVQFEPQSFARIEQRIAPINILIKLIDKLSKLYVASPVRTIEDGNDTDTELLRFYEKSFAINNSFGIGNKFFNLFKNTFMEPFLFERSPKLRALPSHEFIMFSDNFIDMTFPTICIKFMGKITKVTGKDGQSEERELFFIYSRHEFLAVDDTGEIQQQIMDGLNNPEGINIFGTIPGTYINRSKHMLIPLRDTDTFRMTKIIPILLSDLNYAVMFQAFSIIFGIDVDNENINMSPNAFWSFKSDPASDKKPEIGVIKPQVDIMEVIELAKTEMALWLQSRNVKPGAIGKVGAESVSSGFAKMIDEADTFEDRKEQLPFFVDAEADFWNKIINHIHPVWVGGNMIDEKRLFSPSAKVITVFEEPKPLQNRMLLLDELIKEFQAGFTTIERVIDRLNEKMSETDKEELIVKLSERQTVRIET